MYLPAGHRKFLSSFSSPFSGQGSARPFGGTVMRGPVCFFRESGPAGVFACRALVMSVPFSGARTGPAPDAVRTRPLSHGRRGFRFPACPARILESSRSRFPGFLSRALRPGRDTRELPMWRVSLLRFLRPSCSYGCGSVGISTYREAVTATRWWSS